MAACSAGVRIGALSVLPSRLHDCLWQCEGSPLCVSVAPSAPRPPAIAVRGL